MMSVFDSALFSRRRIGTLALLAMVACALAGCSKDDGDDGGDDGDDLNGSLMRPLEFENHVSDLDEETGDLAAETSPVVSEKSSRAVRLRCYLAAMVTHKYAYRYAYGYARQYAEGTADSPSADDQLKTLEEFHQRLLEETPGSPLALAFSSCRKK